MFGSLNLELLKENKLWLLYGLILAVLTWLWIRLLIKKREAEKANVIMFFMMAGADLISIVLTLIEPPLSLVDLIGKLILMVLFSTYGLTELIFYRKKIKNTKQDG